MLTIYCSLMSNQQIVYRVVFQCFVEKRGNEKILHLYKSPMYALPFRGSFDSFETEDRAEQYDADLKKFSQCNGNVGFWSDLRTKKSKITIDGVTHFLSILVFDVSKIPTQSEYIKEYIFSSHTDFVNNNDFKEPVIKAVANDYVFIAEKSGYFDGSLDL